MARIFMTLLGFFLLGVGVWLAVLFLKALLSVLLGLAILVLILFGVLVVIFGVSEMFGARKTPPAGE